MLPAARWYFDADVMSAARLMAQARPDVTFPGDDGERGKERRRQPPSPVMRTDVPDVEWIPVVTAASMSIVTRDRAILSRRAELDVVLSSGARMFTVTSREQLDRWGLLEVLVEVARHRGGRSGASPYVYLVTRSGLRKAEPFV